MQRKFGLILVLALTLTLIAIFIWRQYRQENIQQRATHNPLNPAPTVAKKPELSSTAIGNADVPRLFHSSRYPPETADEKAMWDWWNKMEKADAKFQWKMPIELYGKVVDQFGAPVADATAVFNWTIVGGGKEARRTTARDGRFELVGERGKRLTVDILKQGYLPTRQSFQSFEYAAFFEDIFYVPDRDHPVIFRLQKLIDGEPMLKYLTNTEFTIGGPPVVLNAETGKIENAGDIAVTAKVTGTGSRNGPDYTITLRALGGAGFAFSSEEFMFSAPESGYHVEETFTQLASQPGYNLVRKTRFYLKTRSGKFAAVELETTLYDWQNGGKAGFHALIYHNPSGSRNLEFDHTKVINP